MPDTGSPPAQVDGSIRIAGVVVQTEDGSSETVTLLNASDRAIDLTGWAIANKAKQKHKIHGIIEPGEFMTIPIAGPAFFRDKGDIITLFDRKGLKVAGASYTKNQVNPGWTILF
ncbi:lamin tail domain-containing protein [Paenibacillus sedimenti]|uniref:lamin tail domain-containing protein n=1 Tax=Paenibacillus sedimenti TaxID=2770274 RepID=UPI00289F0A41|nr:lamin tail domain-containing protein [Paenibacillus sedimenti]